MQKYRYEGMDKKGGTVKGVLEAESESDAQQVLRSEGYFVTQIRLVTDRAEAEASDGNRDGEFGKSGCSVGALAFLIIVAAAALSVSRCGPLN